MSFCCSVTSPFGFLLIFDYVAGRGGWGGEQACSLQNGSRVCSNNRNEGGSPGNVYDDTLPLTPRPGSGGGGGAGHEPYSIFSGLGGAGGSGGAAMIFYSEEIVLNGNIIANGSNGLQGLDDK